MLITKRHHMKMTETMGGQGSTTKQRYSPRASLVHRTFLWQKETRSWPRISHHSKPPKRSLVVGHPLIDFPCVWVSFVVPNQFAKKFKISVYFSFLCVSLKGRLISPKSFGVLFQRSPRTTDLSNKQKKRKTQTQNLKHLYAKQGAKNSFGKFLLREWSSFRDLIKRESLSPNLKSIHQRIYLNRIKR